MYLENVSLWIFFVLHILILIFFPYKNIMSRNKIFIQNILKKKHINLTLYINQIVSNKLTKNNI